MRCEDVAPRAMALGGCIIRGTYGWGDVLKSSDMVCVYVYMGRVGCRKGKSKDKMNDL